MDNPSRVYYFDYLRFWAAVAVVLSHVADEFVYAQWPSEELNWFSGFTLGNFLDSLSRFAVSIFFFSSGALLLDEKKKFNFKKQWFKVMWPLVITTFLYVVAVRFLLAVGLEVRIQNLDRLLNWTEIHSPYDLYKTFFAYFMQFPIVFHLWFLYRLLSCYLSIPLLRMLTTHPNEEKKKKTLRYILLVWAISSVLIPTLNHFNPNWFSRVKADFIPAYVGLLPLGYYLHKYKPTFKTVWLVLLWLASLMAIFIFNQIEFTTAEKPYGWAYDNAYIFVIANAVSLFILGSRFLNRPGFFYPFIQKFSAFSFQFYLVHIMVLSFAFCYLWPSWDFFLANPLITIPVTTLVTVGVSYFFCRLGKFSLHH